MKRQIKKTRKKRVAVHAFIEHLANTRGESVPVAQNTGGGSNIIVLPYANVIQIYEEYLTVCHHDGIPKLSTACEKTFRTVFNGMTYLRLLG